MPHTEPKKDGIQEPRPPKQPYTPPTVKVEGNIETLTKEVGLNGADGITGSTL